MAGNEVLIAQAVWLLAIIAQCEACVYPHDEVVGLTVSIERDVTRRDELTRRTGP